MTNLTEAQMIYLQDVLGLHGVVLPREIPVALESVVEHQEAASVPATATGVAPAVASRAASKAEFRTVGDLAASALVCLLWAPSEEAWALDGASGDLARKMVQAMKLSEEDVFWIEWKTSSNQRAPDAVLELVASAGFRPVLGFGAPSVATVTGSIVNLGQWQDWQGVQMMPTHSLPELLANPALKKPAWAHLQTVMKVM